MSIPESHLAQEAIAALVDGELPSGPATRAARHLGNCLQCRLAVQAQREAKDALHESADVVVPGDLMSRLCAIPFTTDVPGPDGGFGSMSAGPGELTVRGASGSFSVDLHPQLRPSRTDHARWLRRSLAGTLIGLGAGVTALALTLPSDDPGTPDTTRGTIAGPSTSGEHSDVVPPVVRTINVRNTSTLTGPGGTP
jgi:anti-sigma factor RsiW